VDVKRVDQITTQRAPLPEIENFQDEGKSGMQQATPECCSAACREEFTFAAVLPDLSLIWFCNHTSNGVFTSPSPTLKCISYLLALDLRPPRRVTPMAGWLDLAARHDRMRAIRL
jgi:hypothetical protein